MACEDPTPMLAAVGGGVGQRKLRLFCCACCRGVWDYLGRTRRRAVEIGERYADGRAGWWGTLIGEFLAFPPDRWQSDPRQAVRMAALVAVRRWDERPTIDPITAASLVARMTGSVGARGLADLVRDIFGNPFRPASFSPQWRTADAVSLARQMYEGRDFGAMPILADALQEAGCDCEDVLNHCRDAGATHVRGCWVVDLLLGKE
jgi:hypothetical protein